MGQSQTFYKDSPRINMLRYYISFLFLHQTGFYSHLLATGFFSVPICFPNELILKTVGLDSSEISDYIQDNVLVSKMAKSSKMWRVLSSALPLTHNFSYSSILWLTISGPDLFPLLSLHFHMLLPLPSLHFTSLMLSHPSQKPFGTHLHWKVSPDSPFFTSPLVTPTSI